MFTDLQSMAWLLPLVAIVVTWVSLEFVFRRYGDAIAKVFPGWKNKSLALVLRLAGILAAMDPSLFAPFFGDKPWAGMALFFIGQLIASLRTVTAVPGDNISKTLRAAVSLYTLSEKDPDDIRAGADYLAKRESNKASRVMVERMGKSAASAVEKARAGK